jgi:hypothetical protein
MKRATLTAYPTTPAPEPADLTDRLLERKHGDSASTPAPETRARRGLRLAAATPARPETRPSPNQETPALSNNRAVSSLDAALSAADSAAEALRQASREAPARYDVALHYRLDALAQHLRQVKAFVASLAAR